MPTHHDRHARAWSFRRSTTPRAPRPAGAARRRRGAVLPLVLVLIFVLLGGAALAIDYSRLHHVGGELQTAADAATLAATQEAKRTPALAYVNAVVAAQQLASQNRVANGAGSVGLLDVVPKYYDRTTNATRDTNWLGANAVKTTVRATPTYVLAGALGLAPPAMSRSATAAFGYVVGMSCLRPLLIPYTSLYNSAFRTSHASAPDLTSANLQTLSLRPQSDRSFVFIGPGMSTTYENDGRWLPADFTNGSGTLPGFGDWARGVNCDNARVVLKQTPGMVHRGGTASDFVTEVTNAMASVCVVRFSNDSAKCYASASAASPGVKIRVALGDAASTAAGSAITSRMVTELTLMCYYRTVADQCKNEGPCPSLLQWCAPYRTNNYPPGTAVFMLPTPFPGVVAATPDLAYGPGDPNMASQVAGGGFSGVTLVR